ncbi:MAG: rRNA methyltransferase [Cyanobacteria bacterium SW_9_44_58]|nr:MAG: rRNA methyltransferase [Cyanobacteria bacterium SW_9_44_58]
MLTSIKNPLIKNIRKLHYSKHRKAQRLFLLEGTNLVEAAFQVNYPLEAVCYTSHWQNKHPDLSEKIQQWAQRTEVVSPEIIHAISTTKTPDGVIAIAPHFSWQFPDPSTIQLGLILEQLQDPGNMGTIIRTAAAAFVEGIWASEDSVEFDHPKVLRASVGAWFRLPMATTSDLSSLVQQFPGQVVATVPTAEKTYWEVDFQKPTLILMGNEGAGLSPELANLADEQVTIPVATGVESLNVAIATSLILYEAKRQIAMNNHTISPSGKNCSK